MIKMRGEIKCVFNAVFSVKMNDEVKRKEFIVTKLFSEGMMKLRVWADIHSNCSIFWIS
jgi:hypothetical protein